MNGPATHLTTSYGAARSFCSRACSCVRRGTLVPGAGGGITLLRDAGERGESMAGEPSRLGGRRMPLGEDTLPKSLLCPTPTIEPAS